MDTFVPCDKCAGSGRPGYFYLRAPGQIAIQECECHIKWRTKEKLKLDAQKANLWSTESILNYNPLTDYKGTESIKNVHNLKNYIEKFSADSRYQETSIYMWGPNGTQKTFLAQWLGLEFLRRKVKVKYLLMNQLLSKLSSSFDSDPELQKFRQELLEVDVLILDESFSKNKVTMYKSGYQLPFLDSFLRERCDIYRKGIVYVSNNPPTDVATEGFGTSIQDFVMRRVVPSQAIFEMKDVYMKLATSFDVTKLFD